MIFTVIALMREKTRRVERCAAKQSLKEEVKQNEKHLSRTKLVYKLSHEMDPWPISSNLCWHAQVMVHD